MPVFRVTATEAVCLAEWMGGRLPSIKEYLKAARIEEVSSPEMFNGGAAGLAVGLGATGPWPVDKEEDRDVIGFGCRQLVTNGKEFTRTLQDGPGELPLDNMLRVPRVFVVGTSYLSPSPPTVAALRSSDSVRCTEASYEISFRVVFEQNPESRRERNSQREGAGGEGK
jgi:formylglycine-generating enzyme required for sulfatase activity